MMVRLRTIHPLLFNAPSIFTSDESMENPNGNVFSLQGSRPAGGTSAGMTSSSSQMVSQQTPTSLRGVSSGYRTSVEYNACSMKGVFMPTPPYDLSSSARSQNSGMVGDGGEQTESLPLIAGSMEAVNDKQV